MARDLARTPEVKLAKAEAKKVAKQAEKEAKKAEKEAEKEAKKAAKKAEKEAEKVAKKEAKKAETAAKKEAKKAENVANKDAKKAEKKVTNNAKNGKKNLTETILELAITSAQSNTKETNQELTEEGYESDEELQASPVTIDNIKYLKDADDNLYHYTQHHLIGKFDPNNNTFITNTTNTTQNNPVIA